ncbi:MAG: hypothetical protein Q4D56_05700 [Bacteroides sp.]|nr:hypothetical protein [Bacteroides sp.]
MKVFNRMGVGLAALIMTALWTGCDDDNTGTDADNKKLVEMKSVSTSTYNDGESYTMIDVYVYTYNADGTLASWELDMERSNDIYSIDNGALTWTADTIYESSQDGFSVTYALNDDNRIEQMTSTIVGIDFRYTYAYDSAGRLTTANITSGIMNYTYTDGVITSATYRTTFDPDYGYDDYTLQYTWTYSTQTCRGYNPAYLIGCGLTSAYSDLPEMQIYTVCPELVNLRSNRMPTELVVTTPDTDNASAVRDTRSLTFDYVLDDDGYVEQVIVCRKYSSVTTDITYTFTWE